MIRKFIAAFLIIFFAASTTAFAANEIDWEKAEVINGFVKFDPITRTLRAKGSAVGPIKRVENVSFYKTFARQAARMDALRTLTEVLDDGKSKLSQDSEVFKLLEKNARQVGEAKFSFGNDGTLYCEVTMELVVPADWKN